MGGFGHLLIVSTHILLRLYAKGIKLTVSIYRVILQCSQKGHARLLALRPGDRPIDSQDPSKIESHTCNVPMGIRHFKAAPSGAQFAYAGQEVNLSIWDAERAFSTTQDTESDKGSKKRGREGLFPAEMWRAKNVSHIHSFSLNELRRRRNALLDSQRLT